MSPADGNPDGGRAQLFVLGLRRSGTTIFWKVLKENTPLLCINEPFNPLLRQLEDPAWRLVAEEYYRESLDLLDRLGPSYWELLAPIRPAQELEPNFSEAQRRYLARLLDSSDKVLIESTRCHFKVREIAELASPGAVLVHLYRGPAEFATSHLVPSSRPRTEDEADILYRGVAHRRVAEAVATIRRAQRRATFWHRKRGYDNWSVESIVGSGPGSAFFELASRQGLDAERLARMPAVGKVLAYWKVCRDRIEEDGREQFGERFLSVNLERWAADPAPLLRRILDLVGVEVGRLDTSSVRRPGSAYQPASHSWKELFELLGIDESEGQGGGPSGVMDTDCARR